MRRYLALAVLGLLVPAVTCAQLRFRDLDDPDAPAWAEEVVQPPAFPRDANLREFYVSELTTHKFFIDASTLSVGQDGVVRYVLVVRTGGGSTNVTFEGIRCETREFKTYATGHRDGTWAIARRSEWRRIENKPANRQHAALSRNLFCPSGISIRTPAEGQEALRLGKHPDAL